MKVYYRFSDGGYNKLKPDYVTKKNCLLNFLKHFHLVDVEITIIADKVSEETVKWLEEDITSLVGINYIRTNFGYGSQAYIKVLEMATGLHDNEEIYFVEDDYIHR